MVLSQTMAILDREVIVLLDEVAKYLDIDLANCTSQEERQTLLACVDKALTSASAHYFDMDAKLHEQGHGGEHSDIVGRLVHYQTELTRYQARLVMEIIAANAPVRSNGCTKMLVNRELRRLTPSPTMSTMLIRAFI